MSSTRARLVIAALVLAAGCETVDGVLKADGSGTLQLVYRTPLGATEATERQRYSSDHVKVESLSVKSGDTTMLKLTFDDVTKLSTAAALRNVEVTRTPEDGAEKLTVKIKNEKPVDTKDDTKPGPTFNFTLPGKILEANRSPTVIGDRVTWTFGLRAFAKEPSIDLVVRYAAPAGGEAGTPGKPAPASK